MPYSLRAKLGKYLYQGLLTDNEYQRLCKALDAEKAVKNIISDIKNIRIHRYRETETDTGDISASCFRHEALEIINKYVQFKTASEDE